MSALAVRGWPTQRPATASCHTASRQPPIPPALTSQEARYLEKQRAYTTALKTAPRGVGYRGEMGPGEYQPDSTSLIVPA